jgi:hypothetical protein
MVGSAFIVTDHSLGQARAIGVPNDAVKGSYARQFA